MLQKLGDHIAGCFQRADAAEQRAKQATTEGAKADFLEIAKAWRHLASSYQFAESLERFLLDAERARTPGQEPPPK